MTTVNIQGVGAVNFPDSMTPDQITSAIEGDILPKMKAQAQPKYGEAATRPEAKLGPLTISGETSSGFNPAAAVIGAGRMLDRFNQGIEQAKTATIGTAQTAFGMDQAAELNAQKAALMDQDQTEKTAAYKQLQAVHPGSTQLGELAPALATPWRALPAVAAAEYGSPTERATSAGLALLGNKLAGVAGRVASKQAAASAERASENAAQNMASQPFRDAGYVVPPAQANPTLINRVLEGISGGAKTEQAASRVNEPITTQAAKDALGLPRSAVLSPEALSAYRAQAYQQGYVPLKSVPKIASDGQFATDIAALRPALDKEIPEFANAQIDKTIVALSKPEFSGATAVDLTRRLRSDSSANFKAFSDPEKQALAQVQRNASDAIEGLIERNLAATGDQAKLVAFRQARQRIAQAHTIEDALVGDVVSAKALAKSGAPLQGPLKTAAQFAEQYPKSAQVIDSATKANPFSVVDALMTSAPALYATAAHGAIPGALVAAAGIGGRPLIRSALLSGPYQRFMTSPSERARGLLAQALLNHPSSPGILGQANYQASSPLAAALLNYQGAQ